MLVYAHRAGRGLAPENTLNACQKVLEFAIDYIDFDIGMTKDNLVVVTHDLLLNKDLTRDSEGNFITERVPLHELTYQQLCCYNVGSIKPHTQYASFFPDQQPVPEAKIPLLKEAIEYVQAKVGNQVHFQIEIKTDREQPQLTPPLEKYTARLYQVLQECNATKTAEVQSFDYDSLFFMQKLDPHLKTSYLTHAADNACFDQQTLRDFNDSIPQIIKAFGGSCWGPFQMEVTEKDVTEAKALGLKIVPWGYPEKEGTEFNTSQIRKLIDWGVDGIITDRPDLLLKILNRRSL